MQAYFVQLRSLEFKIKIKLERIIRDKINNLEKHRQG